MLLYATMVPGTKQSIASVFDITERKLAERKLLISENKYRKIFENVQDVFYQTDLEGTIIEISPSIEKYAGFTREELIGSPVQNVYYDLSDREKLIGLLKSDGKVVDYELCLKTKWGRPVITSASSHLIINSSGIPVGIEGSLRDITARKAAEDRVKALLYEKEILLKETHHRVKNNMNAVYGMLYMQSEEIDNPECREILKDAASRVHSMTVLYDKLYRSADFEELSIADYLPLLVDEISSIFNSESKVKFELDIEDFILSSKVISCLGIIVNELITNSMKYAFNDIADGVISISASMKEDEVTLIYKDNGVGIPESEDFENSAGFGMQLVGMLVKQIGGTAEIIRDKGTGFMIRFKV
jgi:PAS domain S-box-containing protein